MPPVKSNALISENEKECLRSVKGGVIGVVVFGVYLVLHDAQGACDFTFHTDGNDENLFFVVEYEAEGVDDMKKMTGKALESFRIYLIGEEKAKADSEIGALPSGIYHIILIM